MSQISINEFLFGVQSIANQKPIYKTGHDCSDGSCDGIGFIRGALLRSGVIKITHMKEINQFARKTAVNLHAIDSSVKCGSILLKSADDSMPLPSKYRNGGSDYNGDTVNYIDIAVVMNNNPFSIIYMGKEGIIVNSDINEWNYVCELPYVVYEGSKKVMKSAFAHSNNGAIIKLYAEKALSCKDYMIIPDDTMIIVNEKGETWSNVSFESKTGYILTSFVKEIDVDSKVQVSELDRVELEKAYRILGKVLGYMK